MWLLDRACDWPDGAMDPNPQAVTGAKVTIQGLDDGQWSIEWWDTLSGKRIATHKAAASGGMLQLEAPAFQVDIAARATALGSAGAKSL